MIRMAELDGLLLQALPELAGDYGPYQAERARNPEFTQSFFGYSFVPTLQSALDRGIQPFLNRAFALIERLVIDGDEDVSALLREEFFEYGPACEKWMLKALPYFQPRARALAARLSSRSSK